MCSEAPQKRQPENGGRGVYGWAAYVAGGVGVGGYGAAAGAEAGGAELNVATGVGGGGIGAGGVVAASNAIAGLELMTNWAALSISLRL